MNRPVTVSILFITFLSASARASLFDTCPTMTQFHRVLQQQSVCPPATPKPPNPPSPASVFKNTMLSIHNTYRKRHQAVPMTWNNTIAASAQRWANRCMFMHESQRLYGENLYLYSAPQSTKDAATMAANLWYNEVRFYNYQNAQFSYRTGHFTCMVWRATRQLGCAMRVCPNGNTIVVCRYSPHCNVIGQFRNNVLPPR